VAFLSMCQLGVIYGAVCHRVNAERGPPARVHTVRRVGRCVVAFVPVRKPWVTGGLLMRNPPGAHSQACCIARCPLGVDARRITASILKGTLRSVHNLH
jgi:hypothetical protein